MVAQVDGDHRESLGPAPGQGGPVVGSAKQAVQDDQRVALALDLMVEDHNGVNIGNHVIVHGLPDRFYERGRLYLLYQE